MPESKQRLRAPDHVDSSTHTHNDFAWGRLGPTIMTISSLDEIERAWISLALLSLDASRGDRVFIVSAGAQRGISRDHNMLYESRHCHDDDVYRTNYESCLLFSGAFRLNCEPLASISQQMFLTTSLRTLTWRSNSRTTYHTQKASMSCSETYTLRV